MSEELKPMAWLLTGSRIYVDSAYTSEEAALRVLARRGKDTATIVPLYAIASRDAEVQRLREALADVMTWIDNWPCPMTDDPEWAATDAAARAALKEQQ